MKIKQIIEVISNYINSYTDGLNVDIVCGSEGVYNSIILIHGLNGLKSA